MVDEWIDGGYMQDGNKRQDTRQQGRQVVKRRIQLLCVLLISLRTLVYPIARLLG